MANPIKAQDRAFDTYDHYKKFGFVMFKQNKRPYEHIAKTLKGTTLEAGGGMGLGAHILDADLSTDLEQGNIDFARELYPRLKFDTWDITSGPWKEKYDNVVCVEAVEHVEDIHKALHNLIASAKKNVWFSTPNNYEPTPSNPYHVREYTREEILFMLDKYDVKVYHWDTFEEIKGETDVNPLVYHICL